jgi:carboxypeptidase PM20D1
MSRSIWRCVAIAVALAGAAPAHGQPEGVDFERAQAVLAEYIRIDTTTPPVLPRVPEPAYIRLLAERYAEPLALQTDVFDGRILLIRWLPAEPPERAPVLFLGHADVVPVPVEERDEWTHPPFSGAIADGFIWGRGAIDNKASSVALLEAIASLRAIGVEPTREIQLLVTPDEEIGGREGALRYIRDHMDEVGRPAFVIDEGSFIVPDFVPGKNAAAIAVGEKGYLTVRLSVEADGGHSSMPYGQSAPEILTRALANLNAFRFPVRLTPPVARMLDVLGEQFSGAQGLLLRNRWLTGPLVQRELAKKPASNAMLRNTLALTVVNIGVQDNVIPGQAEAFYNLRLLPGESKDAVMATLREVVGDDRVQLLEHVFWGDTPTAPMEGEAWDALSRAIERTIADSFVVPTISPATTDSRYFAQAGVPAYRLLPFTLDATERQRLHAKDERLSLANFAQAIAFYRAVLEELVR